MEENCRVKLSNLPSFTSFQCVKKFLNGHLAQIPFRKLKHSGTIAYFSLGNGIEAENAVKLLNKVKFKKNELKAKVVENEALPSNIQKENKNDVIEEKKTARELVTPLAGLAYAEQIEWKFAESKRFLTLLKKQMLQANIMETPKEEILQKVLPSPVIEGYRNKCEFAIGYSDIEEGEQQASRKIIVGFTGGKMSDRQLRVVPADDCPNLSRNMLAIVNRFQQFVSQFAQNPFDEFKRTGFWKMLTVKDFLGECMLIVTVHPNPETETITKIKQALIDVFLPSKIAPETSFEFNVSSIYWQEQENIGDPKIFEHLAGTPYIYESLLGIKFRISPSTFFQTNSRAAAILYTQIGDLLGLPNSLSKGKFQNSEIGIEEFIDSPENDGETSEKKPRLDIAEAKEREENAIPNSTIFLDICCGAGSIGLCLMHRLRKALHLGIYPANQQFGCVGIELNVDAIKDAKRNAAENGFNAKSCVFIDGQAEQIFSELKFHVPAGCTLTNSQVYGIVDPPRAGLSDKVIIGCRKLIQLKTLAYVSCDPKSVIKNLVDLCRPCSRKFDGEPFKIVAIQPVDMFPLTEHFEWIVKLER